MKVLIVDDEPAARAKLRRLLAAHADVSEVVEAADAPAALALAGPFDLALLDIEMPGGSGLQLAGTLRAQGLRALVFSTAYAEHALRAFELGALDYLLKPFLPERLAETLARVREQLALAAPAARLAAPAGEWWVETREGHQRIVLAEVQWLAAADNYIALHRPPQQFLERITLQAALERPAWAGLFLRVHRSHAVNPAHVMQVQAQPNGEALLTLRCGEQLRVSRGHRGVLEQLAPPR
jgi:DNA-binding LytR/AlgR family response regulator